MPMVNKPGKVVKFNKELPSINSEDPLVTWSRKVMYSMLYLLYHSDYWLPNLAGWFYKMKSFLR